ncbi:hypothetical protein FRB96_008754 [Tulasnella sp. 330]|nr:hypothetical protein FRB96_008754 [Tulasnella sp. 330]
MTTTYKIITSESNTATTIDTLIRFLTPFLPSSLSVVAHLRAPPRPPSLTIYSSFDLDILLNKKVEESRASCALPALFSIATQCGPILRFFCSDERNIDDDDGRRGTAETDESKVAAAHVKSFFESWVPILLQESSGRPCLIGSLRHCWVPFLKTWAVRVGIGGQKYIWDLSLASSSLMVHGDLASPLAVPPGFILTQLSASEIPRVIETSGLTRSREEVQQRLPYSLCLRRSGGETGTSTVAGWALIRADGTIGTLWIEPKFRGKGYTRYILYGLVQTQRRLLAVAGEDDEKFCINVGVMKDNIAAAGLFEALGWKRAWKGFWVAVAPADSPDILSASRA